MPRLRSGDVKRMAAALGMVMVLAVACSDEAIVIDERPELLVHMNVGGNGGPPSALLDFRGARHNPKVGSNCWSGGGATRCADATPDVVVPRRHVDVPKGIHLLVLSDATSFTALLGTVSHESGEVELQVVQELEFEGGLALIDVPPGEYTLLIEGEWEQGAVPFYFGIRVNPSFTERD